jgi:tetratricopeptide (TPR) repeat protein
VITFRWWQERAAGQASSALLEGLKPLDLWTAQEAEALQPHGQPGKRTPKGKFPDAQARAAEMLKQVEAGVSAYGKDDIGGALRLLGAAAALNANDKAKASEHAAAALKQLPAPTTQPFAVQVQASLLASEGRLEEAVAAYQQILAQGAHFAPFALMNIGALREQMGQEAAAAEAYRQLLQAHPQFQFKAQVRHRLGLLVPDLDAYLAQGPQAAKQP